MFVAFAKTFWLGLSKVNFTLPEERFEDFFIEKETYVYYFFPTHGAKKIRQVVENLSTEFSKRHLACPLEHFAQKNFLINHIFLIFFGH